MFIRYDTLYLRCIAITSIVLYHSNDALLKGGFIGVDILILIAGFLNIYSLRRCKKEFIFSYMNFILKRCIRLLLSSLLVLFYCTKYVSDYKEIYYSLLFYLII